VSFIRGIWYEEERGKDETRLSKLGDLEGDGEGE
jgi:hypothetical protein